MSGDVGQLNERLKALHIAVHVLASTRLDDGQRRFHKASADLIERYCIRFDDALAAGDKAAVLWALRSVANLMKGLIEIGSDLPDVAPALWHEAHTLSMEAHHTELMLREA